MLHITFGFTEKMIVKILWFLSCLILVNSNDGVPNPPGLNWYESLPAVAMDYKVNIDAGKYTKSSKTPVN